MLLGERAKFMTAASVLPPRLPAGVSCNAMKMGMPLPAPPSFWRNDRYSVLRVLPNKELLLNRLAVEREVETVLLDLGVDPEADHDIDDLQEDQ